MYTRGPERTLPLTISNYISHRQTRLLVCIRIDKEPHYTVWLIVNISYYLYSSHSLEKAFSYYLKILYRAELWEIVELQVEKLFHYNATASCI